MNKDDEKWVREAVERNGEAMERCGVFLSIFSEHYNKDPIAVLQFGLAVILDKPICLLIPYGLEIPENLKRVARHISFFVKDNQASLEAATRDVMFRAGVCKGAATGGLS